jgi:hypothetical protein
MSDRIPEFYPATERRAVKIRIFRGSLYCFARLEDDELSLLADWFWVLP